VLAYVRATGDHRAYEAAMEAASKRDGGRR